MIRNNFDQYVEQYGNTLSRLCFSLCRNQDDAADLYQETWLKAYSTYGRYEIKDFEKWLYTVCVNVFRDQYRKKIRRPQEVQFDSNEHKDAFMASLSDSDEYDESDYAALYEAVDKLPEKLKIVISLKYFSELSCAEISSMLDISVSAVTTRLSRAIKLLAKEMNAERSKV